MPKPVAFKLNDHKPLFDTSLYQNIFDELPKEDRKNNNIYDYGYQSLLDDWSYYKLKEKLKKMNKIDKSSKSSKVTFDTSIEIASVESIVDKDDILSQEDTSSLANNLGNESMEESSVNSVEPSDNLMDSPTVVVKQIKTTNKMIDKDVRPSTLTKTSSRLEERCKNSQFPSSSKLTSTTTKNKESPLIKEVSEVVPIVADKDVISTNMDVKLSFPNVSYRSSTETEKHLI